MLRAREDLTQGELSKLIDVSKMTVNSWENGNSCPNLVNLIILSKFFKCKIDELI
jgi:DNA-binding XRE family transcriptional regulator